MTHIFLSAAGATGKTQVLTFHCRSAADSFRNIVIAVSVLVVTTIVVVTAILFYAFCKKPAKKTSGSVKVHPADYRVPPPAYYSTDMGK